jgi:choline dehydrogenase
MRSTQAETARDPDAAFAARVHQNQERLTAALKSHYDFIVCGSGSSGSVVARRLAESPDVSVLLVEAGGTDDVPTVWDAVVWARGHQNDWDFFASEANDPAWNYQSVLRLYRDIEDWRGIPDPLYRGMSGPVFVQPTPDPSPIGMGVLHGARSVGIPTFDNQNGRMMEGAGGAALLDVRIKDERRLSVHRSYTYPYMDRSNLTVLTSALVTRLTFDGKRVTGVEIAHNGQIRRIGAGLEVVLSLGAIHTPKVLMQSGIGDYTHLRRFGIPLVQHLPGVGQNLQGHFGVDCLFEYRHPHGPRGDLPEATFFWKSDAALATPDIQAFQFNPPANAWTLHGGIVRPKSRGETRLTGPNPLDPVELHANTLSHPDDMQAAVAGVALCREIGNSAALRPYTKGEVTPGRLVGSDLESFIRDAASTYHHQTSTAKMGRDAMSVVNGRLQVYGIDNLRIADASIMPRVTTGSTMAPGVVIGERASEILRAVHEL